MKPYRAFESEIPPAAVEVAEVGAEATRAAIDVLFEHLKLHVVNTTAPNFHEAATDGRAEYFFWTGDVWNEVTKVNREGKFFIPALFRTSDLRAMVDQVRSEKCESRRAAGKPPITRAEALHSLRTYHNGLGASRVALSIAAYGESDHLTRSEQKARWLALEEATGLRRALSTFSGRKSDHNWISYSRGLRTDGRDGATRLENQKLIIALVEGDTQIVDAGRIMRLPGWDSGDGRRQSINFIRDVHFDPYDVNERLWAYASTLGCTKESLDTTVSALRTSEDLDRGAKHETSTGIQAAMRAHASLLRATRFTVSPEALAHGKEMLPKLAGQSRAGASRSTRSGKPVFLVPIGSLAAFRSLGHKSQDHVVPCCGKKKGVVLRRPGEALRVYCNRCHHTLREDADPEPGPMGDDLDSALDGLGGDDLDPGWRERERAAEMRESMYRREKRDFVFAEHDPKIQARRAKAEAMDPLRGECAARAVALAKSWRPTVRDHLVALGLPKFLARPCVFRQGLGDVQTYCVAVVSRGCNNLSCPSCSSRLIATKAAAVCATPIVAGDGRIVGPSLDRRPALYRYEIPADDLRRWTKRFRDAKRPSASIKEKVIDAEGRFEGETYVAFEIGTTVSILSTLELPPNRKGGGGAPVARLTGHEAIRAEVLRLVLATYRVSTENEGLVDLDGAELSEITVTGTISSSRGLCLDPDRILSEARPNNWVLIDAHPKAPREAAGVFRRHRTRVSLLVLDGEASRQVCISGPIEDLTVRERVLADLSADAPAEGVAQTENGPRGPYDTVLPPDGWRPYVKPPVLDDDALLAGVDAAMREIDDRYRKATG